MSETPQEPLPVPAAPVPPPRQTLSYLHRLFEAHGLSPKSKLGQNFLIDLNLLDLIVRTAELDKSDAVLEVGTGTGSLTAKLADPAGVVVTVEVDRSIQPVAKEIVGGRSNVRFVFGDALAKKSELNPDMLSTWDAAAKEVGCTRKKLVANLPYVIATPLISNLLIGHPEIERMVVMVQWEIAERMKAVPNTKDYNALSVLVQSVADVETVRKVAPTNFHPRPKVDSAIVLIKPNAEKRAKVGDVMKFRIFLRDLYVHRRKNLRQALVGWPTGPREKKDVDAKLAELGIDGTLRSEALDIEQHLRLAAVFG
ncbi:Ribosomal RNA adenine dimethylase [Gemmata obscuriglobus]|uniref:Ribosomal RNA small subunit methyltransferase A n=1 Tax=Gemmata obscuriglobus TaxID=114 RepID=A0A2Z3H3L9_9BACT|nr:16S rRNA (adenine(1518)-N(6)/adenine(1519)-N(6))-dimethyltransferase RsmA [Gemmata obscuriglobus]AWM39451.1 ribosomal RNA small subunit methyltransferase A [Gemmata obscuriglobus]QEG27466.1 Ribosomal RNA adenine dimethylase [Gemmata obscuriglobus]VTS04451.1 dimethyladenosine transferase : Ribosomal RNA small subunit methyltransferase A OS=uncultured planctomycete GN=rsmA PE=3 SV=1: RrnaAD [Gemmata obscuriglobus UQM 2246]